MRSMLCAQCQHSFDDPHRHLLLMMDFDYPLAFRHKKGEYIFEHLQSFCFQGESIFFYWSLWRLDCIQVLHFVFILFSSFCFVGLFMLGGDTFIVLYVSCFNCLLIYIYELFIDICLYCVLVEIKNLFCLLVFSIHAVMHFVQCFKKYTS